MNITQLKEKLNSLIEAYEYNIVANQEAIETWEEEVKNLSYNEDLYENLEEAKNYLFLNKNKLIEHQAKLLLANYLLAQISKGDHNA